MKQVPAPNYTKHPTLNLYTRADFTDIADSDGDEVERRILAAVEAAQDRSVFSEELMDAITDWPSEYHFTRQRHCLLRPLTIKPGEKVLELGCGCGTITRYLGEIGAEVTSVEGGMTRARIAATRCADLPNVKVLAEDLTRLELGETFDWVLLVGVLEYLPIFSDAPDPASNYLESLLRHLAPEGRVVLAIENKLGLKYFNACGEDHLGTPFIGVQGLYGPTEPRTYGRRELQSLLQNAGLAQVNFLYPFPDYKLPRILLTDAGLTDPDFDPVQMLATMQARDYTGHDLRLFDEPLVLREIARNGLLGDMSHSFLAVASRQPAEQEGQLLAVSYAVARRPEFATETRVERRDAEICVIKTHIYPELSHRDRVGGKLLENHVGMSTYIAGDMAMWRLTEARARRGGIAEIVSGLSPWFTFILGKACLEANATDAKKLSAYVIDGAYLDLTPSNLIETKDGFSAIDQEWQLEGNIPLGWLVTRSIVAALNNSAGFEIQHLRIYDVIMAVCDRHGLTVADDEIAGWAEMERKLQTIVGGGELQYPPATVASHRRIPLTTLASEQAAAIADRDLQISSLKQNIVEIRASTSWRVTKPLRALSNSARAMRHHMKLLRAFVSRRINFLKPPLFLREDQPVDTKAHLHIDGATIHDGILRVQGWAYHEQARLQNAQLILSNGIAAEEIPIAVGRERSDVWNASGQNPHALHSGFFAAIPIEKGQVNSIIIELQPSSGPAFRARIAPRTESTRFFRFLRNLFHALNKRRIRRGLSSLVRGEWQFIGRQLRRLGNDAQPSATRPSDLGTVLDLLAGPSAPEPAPERITDIIIPVYNGFDYLRPLFESIARNTQTPYRLIVIDDASPDERVWPLLKALTSAHREVVLVRNEKNLGFVGTVNKAVRMSRGDFALLNTDVEVPPKWLERLMAPIRQERKIASTTPFSNAATICSFPEMNIDGPILGGFGAEDVDRWFQYVRADFPWVDLPSGVGFCMGVNGDVWQQVGQFDEKTFGRGYGEENDWCQRAIVKGFRNIAVPNLFVYHKHGGSFESDSRNSLRETNLQKLQARWPTYQDQVEAFVTADPLEPIRQIAMLLAICGEAPISPVLIVDHDLGGGANTYRKKVFADCLARRQPVLLLCKQREGYAGSDTLVLTLFYEASSLCFAVEDCSVLLRLFEYCRLGEIFFNNAVSFERPLDVVRTLGTIKQVTGAKLQFAVHDFYALCPSYTLLDVSGQYDGVSNISRSWEDLDRNRFACNPQNDSIEDWHSAWGDLLSSADEILCFSENSRQHVEQVYPECAQLIRVRPHKLPVKFSRKPKIRYDDALHIGVIGAINYQKGASIVVEMADILSNSDTGARITVVGVLDGAPHYTNLHVTGPYRCEELPDLLERHGINVCILPSIVPETFSYVTEELMALEVPLVCFDLGAPAERVARYPLGRVVTQKNASAALEALVELHGDMRKCRLK